MIKRILLISSLIALLFATGSIQSGDTDAQTLKNLVYKACSEENAENQYGKLLSIQSRLRDKANWRRSAENIIYIACFQEYPSWLTGLAFNLGIIGLNEGLKEETLEDMTRLLGHKTVGKNDYILLGRLYEKLRKTGVDDEYIHELIITPLSRGYSPEAIESVSLLYLQEYKKSKQHDKAITLALNTSKALKSARTMPEALDQVFPAEVAEGEKAPALHTREEELEKKRQDYWKSVERSIRNKPVFKISPHKWNLVKLKKFVDSWLGVPYLYGGLSRNGIDCSGLVIKAAQNQFKSIKLPRTAAALSKVGRKVSVRDLQPGDLLFFSGSKTRRKITHVGIYIEKDTFVHASSSRGVTQSALTSNYYKSRLIKAQRVF